MQASVGIVSVETWRHSGQVSIVLVINSRQVSCVVPSPVKC